MATCTGNGDDGLCGTCQRIEDIDAQIVQVEDYLASLKATRMTLKSARNASHDRLTRRLPLEMVSQIFKIYVDAAFDYRSDVLPFLHERMQDAPLRLGAVCHAWRAIAWASPRLWNKISVDVLRGRGKLIPELAMQWLERTGQLPLTICLYDGRIVDDSVADANKEFVIWFMLSFCKFASRWRTFAISLRSDQYIDDDNAARFWSPDIDIQDCNLQYLRLLNCSPFFTAHLFQNFRRKPSPTYISLHNLRMRLMSLIQVPSPRLGSIDIDWSNATTINVDSLTFEESIRILRASVRLQTFHLGRVESRPNSMPPSSPIIIPTLLSLHSAHSLTSIILDCLTLPLLENLHWSTHNGTFDSLISLVGRSHCRLVSLTIMGFKITDEFLLFLQTTPSLESLSIHDSLDDGNAERLLNFLATSDGSIHMPNLGTLQLMLDPRRTLPWEAIPVIFDPGRLYIGDSLDLSASLPLRRRSLSLLLDIRGTLDEIGYIDLVSLHHISVLIEKKVDISIIFRGIFEDPKDFISVSMDYHCPDESSTDYESDSYSYDPMTTDYGSESD